MAKLVSKTYGDALFELALSKDVLKDIWDEVTAVGQIWKDNADIESLMEHPRIDIEEKVQLIKNIFEGRVSDIMTGFLVTVLEKGRASELENIFDYFTDRAREYYNIGVAYVTSAVELNDSQKKQIEKRLIEVTKYVEFVMNYSVEPKLIGGMIIRIGDRVMDNSIRNKLNTLSRTLTGIQLN